MRNVVLTSALAGLLLPAAVTGKVSKLLNVLHNGTVTDETVAGDGSSLDGLKLSTTSNETTYEWYEQLHHLLAVFN